MGGKGKRLSAELKRSQISGFFVGYRTDELQKNGL
jgi:hypothetical protein